MDSFKITLAISIELTSNFLIAVVLTPLASLEYNFLACLILCDAIFLWQALDIYIFISVIFICYKYHMISFEVTENPQNRKNALIFYDIAIGVHQKIFVF